MIPVYLGSPALPSGRNADEFNAVALMESAELPFAPKQSRAVVFDQNGIRSEVKFFRQLTHVRRAPGIHPFAIQQNCQMAASA